MMKNLCPILLLILATPVSSAEGQPGLKPSGLPNANLPSPHEVRVDFQSQDDSAYNCAVGIARAHRLNAEVTTSNGSSSMDSKKSIQFTKQFAKLDASADGFVASFMRCQTQTNSTASCRADQLQQAAIGGSPRTLAVMHPNNVPDLPSFGGFVPDEARRLFKAGQLDQALQYIGEFVASGNAYAMLAMADYEYDQGNTEASLSWVAKVEQAAAADDYEACIYLSSAYQRGLGLGSPEERQAKSLLMLERAAEHGYVSCAHALMSNYLYGLNGAPVSKERFTYWARKAASYGSASAQDALGKLKKWPNVAPGTNDG